MQQRPSRFLIALSLLLIGGTCNINIFSASSTISPADVAAGVSAFTTHHFHPTPRLLRHRHHNDRQLTGSYLTALRQSSLPSSTGTSSPIAQLLDEHGFGDRLVTLDATSLTTHPVLAETYQKGTWRLCIITDILPPLPQNNKMKKTKSAQPKLQVSYIPLSDQDIDSDDLETKTIGIGDITTIWLPLDGISHENLTRHIQSIDIQTTIQQDFAINYCEQTMQKLYNERANRNMATKAKNALTKKQIPKIAAKVEDSAKAEELLRTAMKAGPGMHRLVDSTDAVGVLYADSLNDHSDVLTELRQRLVSAEVLSSDAQLGGRFKRMPCNFVAADICNDDAVEQITAMNGGWLAVDSGNRAGAEARKLVGRSVANASDNSQKSVQTSSSPLLTAADERIVSRLECMAMGEAINVGTSLNSPGSDDTRMEVDVRETLRAMKLPVSAVGAKDALVRLGRWTEGDNISKRNQNAFEPWPVSVLDAATSLAKYEKQRKQQLAEQCKKTTGTKAGQIYLEGRTNLSMIPCVCVDAKGTAFRDDAIGVRPRSSTGRKVTNASKWEILLHISDVSDIFSPDLGGFGVPYDPIPLRQGAEKRGYSRYDLPLGPLHLMPPVALKALALDPATDATDDTTCNGVNRCVTLWVYIDEKTGKLVDAGLERSITSAPVPFTYASATSFLDGNVSPGDLSAVMQKAKSILALAERNLSLWSEHQRRTNVAAARRHERMAAKQIISDATSPLDDDDVVKGKKFQYSRGHRVVDSALDLYGYALTGLLKQTKVPIPNAPGQGDRRGRLGTAPLRRYVDAMAQRQALSALCNYGGPPLTKKECNEVYLAAAKAGNAIKTIRSTKKDKLASGGDNISPHQQRALERLEGHLARIGNHAGGDKRQTARALSTGRENEVVLEGIAGLTVKCSGVEGTLKPGEKVMVQIISLDPAKGKLRVRLDSRRV